MQRSMDLARRFPQRADYLALLANHDKEIDDKLSLCKRKLKT